MRVADMPRLHVSQAGSFSSMASSSKVSAVFPPEKRIRRSTRFREIMANEPLGRSRSFLVFSKPNAEGMARLGLTVTRKLGCAVERNRVKRVLREVFRREQTLFPVGVDVVILARKPALDLTYERARHELAQLHLTNLTVHS